MLNKKSVFAITLAMALLFVMLFSALYIAAEAGHDCTGEGCRICCQVAICRSAVKWLGSAVISAAAAALSFISVLCGAASVKELFSNISLITLKVKLSD